MGLLKRSAKRDVKGFEKIVDSKIHVSTERYAELQAMEAVVREGSPEKSHPTRTVLCLNLSEGVAFRLMNLSDYGFMPSFHTIVEAKAEEFYELFKSSFIKDNQVDAVLMELKYETLSMAEKRVFALSTMFRLPVVAVSTSWFGSLQKEVQSFTGGTWPLLQLGSDGSGIEAAVKWLSHDLPLLRALQEALDADITSRVGHLAEVNVPRYFITRAAVSLVPGAILATNMISSMWRVGKMMELTGMMPDDPSSKTGKSYLQKLGIMSTAKVAAVESLGDVYQYAVYIWLAAAAADAAAGGASLAATLVDEVLLGSVVVLAGALSTFAAVYSRPLFVARAGEFLAMLQLIYLINPRMRRAGGAGCRVVEDDVVGCAEQEQQEGEGEEARKVQQASRCAGTGAQLERVDMGAGGSRSGSSSRDQLLLMQMGPLRRRLVGRLRTFSCPGDGGPAGAAAAGGHGLGGDQQAVGSSSSSSSSGQARVHSAMAVHSARQ